MSSGNFKTHGHRGNYNPADKIATTETWAALRPGHDNPIAKLEAPPATSIEPSGPRPRIYQPQYCASNKSIERFVNSCLDELNKKAPTETVGPESIYYKGMAQALLSKETQDVLDLALMNNDTVAEKFKDTLLRQVTQFVKTKFAAASNDGHASYLRTSRNRSGMDVTSQLLVTISPENDPNPLKKKVVGLKPEVKSRIENFAEKCVTDFGSSLAASTQAGQGRT